MPETPKQPSRKELKERISAIMDEDAFIEFLYELTPEELRFIRQTDMVGHRGNWPHRVELRLDEIDREEVKALADKHLTTAAQSAEAASSAAKATYALVVLGVFTLLVTVIKTCTGSPAG